MANAALKTQGSSQQRADGAKGAVRDVLDRVKAEGRTSLTAPEGKLVCDAYGIPVPKEGVANSAQDAAKLADGMGLSGGAQDRVAGHPSQDGGGRRAGRPEKRRRGLKGL